MLMLPMVETLDMLVPLLLARVEYGKDYIHFIISYLRYKSKKEKAFFAVLILCLCVYVVPRRLTR